MALRFTLGLWGEAGHVPRVKINSVRGRWIPSSERGLAQRPHFLRRWSRRRIRAARSSPT